MPSLCDSQTIHTTLTTDFILIFTHSFLTSVVLVIESLVAIEHEHRRPTEHEHEFTNKSVNINVAPYELGTEGD